MHQIAGFFVVLFVYIANTLSSLKLVPGLSGVLVDSITRFLIFHHLAPCPNHLAFLVSGYSRTFLPATPADTVDLWLVSPPLISCKHLNLQNIWTKQDFTQQEF